MPKPSAVLSLKKLLPIVRQLQRAGHQVAFTNGCFDLLHVGHLDTLEQAKRHADYLIVGINSDASTKRLKGPGRPILPAGERARLVAALKPVDYVVLFSESTPYRLIQKLHPDLIAKGGDWKPEKIVGANVMKASGGKVLVIPYRPNHSTTQIIERIKSYLKRSAKGVGVRRPRAARAGTAPERSRGRASASIERSHPRRG